MLSSELYRRECDYPRVSVPAESPFSLEGKTALVTGCRRGIGKAAAVALAAAGADVAGMSASLEEDGGDVAREVEALGRQFRGYRCDLADRAAVYGFLEALARDVPRVDILVNNAGTIARSPAAEYADEDWDRVIEIDLSSQFVLTRELGKGMLERGSGKIVFVASLLSFQGGITVPAYAAAKGGIAQLTKALANEWAPRGVNVNAVAPGYIRTDINQTLREDPERAAEILVRIPAGRWGEPGDLAGAMVFLASAASDYVNGIVLPVDGGWLGR
jgi:2-deoxy-D-gluconate 3-dehydrogenase